MRARKKVPGKSVAKGRSCSLMVRMDETSKAYLAQAAELRRISVSDYVRLVTVAQAKREVMSAASQSIAMTADEQLAFWNALNASVELTSAQRQLGVVMRGET